MTRLQFATLIGVICALMTLGHIARSNPQLVTVSADTQPASAVSPDKIHPPETSSIKPYKRPAELEVDFDRLSPQDPGIYDYVYHLAESEELVLKIRVDRHGKLDSDKSHTMRVHGTRSRFIRKGVGTFRVKYTSDGWSFDLDTGGSYGLFFHDPGNSFGATVGESTGSESPILQWAASNNDLRIKITATIQPVTTGGINPTIEPLESN